MARDRDVWLTACAMIGTYGDNAPLYVLQSVDQLVERGDFKRAEEWRQVWRASVELLRAEPAAEGRIN
jgi:hypothetical protein